VVTAAHDYLDRLRRESGNTESFEKSLTDLRAADLRFVVDKLEELLVDSSFEVGVDSYWSIRPLPEADELRSGRANSMTGSGRP
jgi:hypothetical protein